MGDLLNQIRQVNRRGPARVQCSVARILGQLDDESRADLVTAIDDLNVSASAIASVLRDKDFHIRDETIRRHRNNGCACRKLAELDAAAGELDSGASAG